MKDHAVIYGGLSDNIVSEVANKYEILIVGSIRGDQLRRIKQINPNIIILKYHHSIGMHRSYSDWAVVNRKESWFGHDRITGKRLIEKQYGWYLMDVTNPEWQIYQVKKIVDTIGEPYDGVFLDDFWERYVTRFQDADTGGAPTPDSRLMSGWDNGMRQFLSRLKAVYAKQIFINGACAGYLSEVDGCMVESFVHSSWTSDSFFHNQSTYLRSLEDVSRISTIGKNVLVQSGTNGDGAGSVRDIFNYCYASYLLVMNENTSFYFQPQRNAVFKDAAFYPDVRLGASKGLYYVQYAENAPQNLLRNGDFRNGLISWNVTAGSPSAVTVNGASTEAVMLSGSASRRDFIQSDFIPVRGNTKYTLSAWCKTAKNEPGSASYMKLGVEGTYYDGNKRFIRSGFGLQFDPGKYDWLPFETDHTSPENAAFFRIGIGFLGDGQGQGWVSKVSFYPSTATARVLRRDFERGSVFVNYGARDILVDTQIPGVGKQHIKRNQGLVIENSAFSQ
jgi:hypothetical protein